MHRPARTRSLLVTALVLTAALLGVWSATANANDVTSFSLTPTTTSTTVAATQAASSPSLTAKFVFNYGTSTTDSVKNIAVTLPSGLLAAPAAVTTLCSSTFTQTPPNCPAASLIGTATATTSVTPLTANLYLAAPPPGSTADVATLDVILSAPAPTSPYAISPVATASGPVYLTADPTTGKPELVMSVDGLPNSVSLGGTTVPFQLTNLSVTVNGTTSTGAPFTRMPSQCSAGTATASIDTAAGNADGTGSATIQATGCSSLPYAPALTAAGAKDASDSGVAVTTVITQAADEATSSAVKLTIPSNVAANLTAAAGELCTSTTFTGCTAVGAAAANSPLLGTTTLSGAVYLTGTLTAPTLTIAFPPPFALELVGSIGITTNTVSFANVPDVPLTKLIVALKGGTGSLFTTSCNPVSSTASAAFLDQNLDKGTTASTPFAVSGCAATSPAPAPAPSPITTSGPGAPKVGSSSLAGLSSGKAKLSLKLVAGNNGAPKLTSATVKLPSGVSFIKAKLKKGVSVKGAKIKSLSLKGGKLTITLKSKVSSFSIKISSSALKVSSSLVAKVKDGKTKTVKLTVTVKNAKGGKKSFTIKEKV